MRKFEEMTGGPIETFFYSPDGIMSLFVFFMLVSIEGASKQYSENTSSEMINKFFCKGSL